MKKNNKVCKTLRISKELHYGLQKMQYNSRIEKGEIITFNALIVDILQNAVMNDNSRYIIEDTTRKIVKEETKIISDKIDILIDEMR